MDKNKPRAMLSWLFVGTLLILCGALGVLQYRWIGEVSLAERDRMQGSLQASLNELSRAFNGEIKNACRALAPSNPQPGDPLPEGEFRTRYEHWKTSRHSQMFSRIMLAAPEEDSLALRGFDLDRELFEPAEWPAGWQALKEWFASRLWPAASSGQRSASSSTDESGLVFELPLFPGAPPMTFSGRETGWLIFELNAQYVRDTMLPELVQRYLSSGGNLDYDVEVVTKTRSPSVIYRSESSDAKPGDLKPIGATADASVGLFEAQFDQIFRRRDAPGGRDRAPVRNSNPDMGRWQMYVRHRAGSLQAVVARARRLNLAVTAGVLLLMLASLAALIRYTRRAQKLAALQMDFIAGVSHELRTPLTVIHTAAYNLRGPLARNPNQVERYGALIQQESGRLKELVEQVLHFASVKAGRVIHEPEPLSVEAMIDETVESTKTVMQSSRCVVEKSVDPDLPLVLGDPIALKQVLQNLITNAAKYGTEGGNWIGVFAAQVTDGNRPVIEIRVADRGPGIPADEQSHIFDPFFRGRRALQDQVHGTGLGLSLVKDIVEAHGGTIRVHSEPAKGTEFVVRIPIAPPEHQDEFAHSFS